MCDGFGHFAEQCPTASSIRDIATSKDFPKVKSTITAAIAAMKIKGFRQVMSN